MKKLFYLLLALPLAIFATSCSDDDKDVPNVDIEATIDAAQFDGAYYVVQGDTLNVESLKLINNSGKNGAIGSATYFMDGFRLGRTIVEPFSCSIATNGLAVGKHTLGITTDLYVVDYPINIAGCQYTINIVSSEDDIPAGAIRPVQPDQPAE